MQRRSWNRFRWLAGSGLLAAILLSATGCPLPLPGRLAGTWAFEASGDGEQRAFMLTFDMNGNLTDFEYEIDGQASSGEIVSSSTNVLGNDVEIRATLRGASALIFNGSFDGPAEVDGRVTVQITENGQVFRADNVETTLERQ